jgi:lipopolysaccharide transport system ATP-binding protein
VSFAEVEKFIETPVKRYSSGMYLRLAFAVAAHLEPEILIVDEVLAVGDAEFQRKCLGKMSDVLPPRGARCCSSSHNMSAILRLTEETLVIDKGKLAMRAPTPQAVDYYLSNGYSSKGKRIWEKSEVPTSAHPFRPLMLLRCVVPMEPSWIRPLHRAIHRGDGILPGCTHHRSTGGAVPDQYPR